MRIACLFAACALLIIPSSAAPARPDDGNPKLAEIVSLVSEENLREYVAALEGFGTRLAASYDLESETRGLGAASKWAADKFRSFSPRIRVVEDSYTLKADGRRVLRDLELTNIIAVLPGRTERIVAVAAHIDSIARNPDTGRLEWANTAIDMPGANDDASGVATVLECARIFSGYEFDATVYFIAFTAEEVGLLGSRLFARRAKEMGLRIDAVINLDMVGNPTGGNGIADTMSLRVFSTDPADSPSRRLARYVKRVGEQYVPSMEARLIFRPDRFGRGGDHTPLNHEGFAAVRLTESRENYSLQHTANDRAENIDFGYLQRNAQITAAALASLAWAPAAPKIADAQGRPMLDRGESGYDVALRWEPGDERRDVSYVVVLRSTTSPYWEWSFDAGTATSFVIPSVCIDDVVVGVQAVDAAGNLSLVSACEIEPRDFPELNAESLPWPDIKE